jgi:hypothetical protein
VPVPVISLPRSVIEMERRRSERSIRMIENARVAGSVKTLVWKRASPERSRSMSPRIWA